MIETWLYAKDHSDLSIADGETHRTPAEAAAYQAHPTVLRMGSKEPQHAEPLVMIQLDTKTGFVTLLHGTQSPEEIEQLFGLILTERCPDWRLATPQSNLRSEADQGTAQQRHRVVPDVRS